MPAAGMQPLRPRSTQESDKRAPAAHKGPTPSEA